MNSTDNVQLSALLSLFVAQLPILIVSLLGCLVIMTRTNDLAGAASWALMGFGLSLVLCIAIPIGQTIIQKWAMEGGISLTQRATMFTILGLVWSTLRAASYALLLMAVITGRPNAARI